MICYISFCVGLISYGQTIETIAGTGSNASSGDGGLATQAGLSFPFDVAIDDNGHVYISESAASRIRRVDANTGIITTIFGGGTSSTDGVTGPNYELQTPGYIHVHNNFLYVADYGLHRIVKMSLTDSLVYTVVGTGSPGFSADGTVAATASINLPYGFDFAEDGILYFVDNDNHRVRYIDANGYLQTLCGYNSGAANNLDGPPGTGVLSEPWGLTIKGDYAYNTEFANSSIREINLLDGNITTISLPGSSFNGDGMEMANTTFSIAIEVLFDYEGNMLVADNESDRIRKVDPVDHIVSTIVGTGVGGYSGDGGDPLLADIQDPIGMCLDQFGNLIFVDNDNNVVRQVEFCKLPDQPIIEMVNPQASIECGSTVELYIQSGSLNGADHWEWFAGDCDGAAAGQGDTISATLFQTTSFFAKGVDGCSLISDCGMFTVNVDECIVDTEQITAFSPNNDGVNDVLIIEEATDNPTNNVFLYNRWGDIMQTIINYDNEENVWDGTDQFGRIVEGGTYFYIFESDNVRLSNWIFVAK